MMNAKAGIRVTVVTVLLISCLFCLEPRTSAQSGGVSIAQTESAQSNCKNVKGNWVGDSSSPQAGTVTNDGFLDGTTVTVYTSTAFSTPVPTTVSFSSEWTLTTHQGQLKVSLVNLYDFVTGLGTTLGFIRPSTSTGRFAGATGVLYFNIRTVGIYPAATYPGQINGEVCFDTNRAADSD